MGDADFLFRRVGDAKFPPDLTADPESLFDVFDPGAGQLLSFFKAAINAELTAAWALARADTALAAVLPVNSTLRGLPTKSQLRAQTITFPALFLARTKTSRQAYTLDTEMLITDWSLDYVLGPLSGGDYQRLAGALHAANAVLLEIIHDRRHPAFESGAAQFGTEGTGRFKEVRMVESVMGPADFGEEGQGLEYFGLHVEIETTETDDYLPGASAPYNGASFTFGVGDAEEMLADQIIARTGG